MHITIIGTGYVGLVTGVCFAEMGLTVTCLDIDSEKIKNLKRGICPIFEPGLQPLMQKNIKAHRLHFTTQYSEALEKASVCFFALPTSMQEDGSANISALYMCTKMLAKHMQHPLILVNKSTAPIGTVDEIKKLLKEELEKENKSITFDVISNPEFLKEGSAVADCMKPDRIIIGATNPASIEMMKKIYSGFLVNHDRMIIMDIRSAEMTKYAANIMLASRISLMNELANFSEQVGANIQDVRIGIGSDRRIGYDFLYSGVGYGGSCFPKDISALKVMGHNLGMDMDMLSSIEKVNQKQKMILPKKIKQYFGQLSEKIICVWGLSFKPETDDIREAPALYLIEELLKCGAKLNLFDPVANENMKQNFPESDQVRYFTCEYKAAEKADAIALVTEWKQFRFVQHEKILSLMHGCAMFDGRNQYNPIEMTQLGYDYFGIGVKGEKKCLSTSIEALC